MTKFFRLLAAFQLILIWTAFGAKLLSLVPLLLLYVHKQKKNFKEIEFSKKRKTYEMTNDGHMKRP